MATYTNGQFRVGTLTHMYGLDPSAPDGALVRRVLRAIDRAERLVSNLGTDAGTVVGMSGRKNRHLLNNLCSVPGTRYLEVGLWRGSTFFAALAGNEAVGVGVDDWSEFDGPSTSALFRGALPSWAGRNDVTVLEEDFFRCGLDGRRFDVITYDGAHDEHSQRRFIERVPSLVDGPAVVVVDDWKQRQVRDGTNAGLEGSGLVTLLSFTSPYFVDRPDPANWWDGVHVRVVVRVEG